MDGWLGVGGDLLVDRWIGGVGGFAGWIGQRLETRLGWCTAHRGDDSRYAFYVHVDRNDAKGGERTGAKFASAVPQPETRSDGEYGFGNNKVPVTRVDHVGAISVVDEVDGVGFWHS